MKYCKSCNLYYDTPLNSCLFCENELESMGTEQTINDNEYLPLNDELTEPQHYPTFTKRKNPTSFLLRLVGFLILIANIVCTFINYTLTHHTLTWSRYVLVGTLYGFLLFIIFTRDVKCLKKIIYSGFLTLASLILIGFLINHYHWALDFVLPFGMIAINMFLVCHLFGKKEKLFDYSIYVFHVSVLGVLTSIFYFSNVLATTWPTIACIGYSILTLLGFFFFSSKEIKEELKRRFYL